MNGKGFAVKTLAEVPSVPQDEPGDPDWRPLQHHFRINAFGLNVFTAPAEGTVLLAPHDERQSGQQELYLVLEGEVAFTLDGEELAATAGTVVAVPDPAVRRGAVARTAGARILAVGAKPVGGFRSTWSPHWFEHVPQF
jgi:quercetin dioxygenase-like cupin family protein